MTCSLLYASESSSLSVPAELKEESEKEEHSADELYTKMREKDDIIILFFERYGAKHKGFYVERNLPNEEKYLLLHAEDQEHRKTVDIKMSSDLQSIESITARNNGEVEKEVDVPVDDKDALVLYRRMLGASTSYIGDAEVTRHSILGNFAKYNKFIEDDQFVSALENLVRKTGI